MNRYCLLSLYQNHLELAVLFRFSLLFKRGGTVIVKCSLTGDIAVSASISDAIQEYGSLPDNSCTFAFPVSHILLTCIPLDNQHWISSISSRLSLKLVQARQVDRYFHCSLSSHSISREILSRGLKAARNLRQNSVYRHSFKINHIISKNRH